MWASSGVKTSLSSSNARLVPVSCATSLETGGDKLSDSESFRRTWDIWTGLPPTVHSVVVPSLRNSTKRDSSSDFTGSVSFSIMS